MNPISLQLPKWMMSFMGITLNFSTGEIGWSSSTGAATVDGVYLTEAGDYFITEAGDYLATE